MSGFIRFNQPSLAGNELEYVRQALDAGHASADGPFTRSVAELLTGELGAAGVFLTTSCTAALEMCGMHLELGPDDVVIVPSFTFVTTASAFVRTGARIRFCDIEPDTLGMDPGHLAELLDDRVRAVVPIHYAGIPCRITELAEVVRSHPGAELIEDNAHGLFGATGGTPLGSFGRFSTLSFHETKNFICGEGGAVVVNRPEDLDRAHVLWHKGTDRRRFELGEVDKYTWQEIGSSFGLADILAAVLLGQLERRTEILEARRRVGERYRQLLAPLADSGRLRLPVVPSDATPAHHLFHVLLEDRATRDAVLVGLKERGVGATFHYVPLHTTPAGRRVVDRFTECPITDDVAGRLLRLPYHNRLSEPDQHRVVAALVEVLDEVAS